MDNGTFACLFSEFMNSAVGAFLGFLFASYLQNKTEKENSKKKITLVLKCICEELQDISDNLKKFKEDEVVSQSIFTPNLSAIVESGIIIELLNKEIYPEIVQVYSIIRRLNEEQNLTKSQKKIYMNNIINESDTIIEFIKKQERSI